MGFDSLKKKVSGFFPKERSVVTKAIPLHRATHNKKETAKNIVYLMFAAENV